MQRIIAIAIAAFLTTGCANRIGDFRLVTTKNIDLARVADFKRSPVRVKAEDSIPIILTIPVGAPSIETALDRAIEKTPGAVALTDAVVTEKLFSIILYGETSYEVEGTPLIDPKQEKAY